MPSHIVAFCLR